ncbi:hypothetical protein T190607A02C_70165 [Tenacibaculum sp. 190524A02b]
MKKKVHDLPPNTIVEVEMTKNMSYSEYMEMMAKAKKKGWRIQAYQLGLRKQMT